MFQFDRFEIECFINKVFYYYNGKINTFNNKLMLFIDWCEFRATNNGARYRHPNIVSVYPAVIFRWNMMQNSDYDSFDYMNGYKLMIIECIIHELYHADQVLVRGLYTTEQAENPVVTETTLYIANHQNEIYDVFGVLVDMDFSLIPDILPKVYYPYHRRNIISHAFTVMSDMLFGYIEYINVMSEAFAFVMQTNTGIISILIGDTDFTVFDEDGWCNLYEFNKFAYNYFCKCLERKGIIQFVKLPNEENWWVLAVQEPVIRNTMCTINGIYKEVEDEGKISN